MPTSCYRSRSSDSCQYLGTNVTYTLRFWTTILKYRSSHENLKTVHSHRRSGGKKTKTKPKTAGQEDTTPRGRKKRKLRRGLHITVCHRPAIICASRQQISNLGLLLGLTQSPCKNYSKKGSTFGVDNITPYALDLNNTEGRERASTIPWLGLQEMKNNFTFVRTMYQQGSLLSTY